MFESLTSYTIDTPQGPITFAPTKPDGATAFLIGTSISSGTDVRRQMESKPRQDGSYVSDAYLDARVITITGRMPIVGAGGIDGQRSARNVLKAQVLGRLSSILRADGYLRWEPMGLEPLTMRVRRYEQPVIDGGPHKNVLISLVAPDPIAYGQTLRTATIGANIASLAFADPAADPLTETIAQTDVINETISNGGNAPTYPRVTVTGPITSPVLTNNTTGESLSFPGLVITAGNYVDIDMANRTALLNGVTTVYGYVNVFSSTFFALVPATNRITLSGSSTSTATNAKFFWNNGYTE